MKKQDFISDEILPLVKRKVGRPRKIVIIIPPPEPVLGWGNLVSEFLTSQRFGVILIDLINHYLHTNPPEGKHWDKDLLRVVKTFSVEDLKKCYQDILDKKSPLPSVTRKWIDFLMVESISKTILYYEKTKK